MAKPLGAIVLDLYALRGKLRQALAQVDRDIDAITHRSITYTVNTRPSPLEGYSVAYTAESDQKTNEEVTWETQSKS